MPSSGGSRAVMVTDPLSSKRQQQAAGQQRLLVVGPGDRPCARAKRSSWFAVIGPAISARSASLSAVAILVSALVLK